jgi:GGDEF domain-containing protein
MRIAKAEMFHGTGNGQSEPIAHELAQVLENTDDAIIVKDLNAVRALYRAKEEGRDRVCVLAEALPVDS